MTFDTLAKEAFELLPYEKQLEVVDFIMFLSAGIKSNETLPGAGTKNSEKIRKTETFPFDVFAGGLQYISEDFDETPEGFEE